MLDAGSDCLVTLAPSELLLPNQDMAVLIKLSNVNVAVGGDKRRRIILFSPADLAVASWLTVPEEDARHSMKVEALRFEVGPVLAVWATFFPAMVDAIGVLPAAIGRKVQWIGGVDVYNLQVLPEFNDVAAVEHCARGWLWGPQRMGRANVAFAGEGLLAGKYTEMAIETRYAGLRASP